MTYGPRPVIQVAWGAGPYDSLSPMDWTTVEDAYEVTVNRGRASEFDQFPPSTMTVSFRNDGRRYDPLNGESPLEGLLLPNVPIRLLADVPATVVPHPVVEAHASTVGTSLNGASVTMPAGVQVGDLLLALVIQDASTTDVTAAGWGAVQATNLPSSVGRFEVMAKYAAGGDTMTLAGATEDFVCTVLRITGHGVTGGGFTGLTVQGASSTTATPTTPTNLGSGLSTLYLGAFGADDDDDIDPWTEGDWEPIALNKSTTGTSSCLLGVAQYPPVVIDPADTVYAVFRMAAAEEARAVLITVAPAAGTAPGYVRVPVWRGFVDRWPTTYLEGGRFSDAVVPCTDAFKLLAERQLPDITAAAVNGLLANPPESWYPMDRVVLGVLEDRNGVRPMRVKGSVQESPAMAPTSAGSVLTPEYWAADPDWSAAIPIASANDHGLRGTVWSCAFWLQMSGQTDPVAWAGGGAVFSVEISDAEAAFRPIDVRFGNAAGNLSLTVNGVGASMTAFTPTLSGITGTGTLVQITDNKPHHIIICRSTTVCRIYVDGIVAALAGNGAATGWWDMTGGKVFVKKNQDDGGGRRPPMLYSDLIMWPGLFIFEADALELYEHLSRGWRDPGPARGHIDAVLDLIGWPLELRAVDEGEVILTPPANVAGLNALEVLQTIAATEQGRLFIDASGRVAFHDRSRFLVNPVEADVQYVFSDQDRDASPPPDVGTLDGTLFVALDDSHLYDGAQVTRLGGVTQESALVANPARTFTLDGLYYGSDLQALDLAEWITFRYGDPQVRTDAWEVDPEVLPGDWADVLALEVGHRVAHDLEFGGVGGAVYLEQTVEVIGHRITLERWTLILNAVPVDPANYLLWAVDDTDTSPDVNGWGDTGGTPLPGGAWG